MIYSPFLSDPSAASGIRRIATVGSATKLKDAQQKLHCWTGKGQERTTAQPPAISAPLLKYRQVILSMKLHAMIMDRKY